MASRERQVSRPSRCPAELIVNLSCLPADEGAALDHVAAELAELKSLEDVAEANSHGWLHPGEEYSEATISKGQQGPEAKCRPRGKTLESVVNPSPWEYSTLPKFGFVVCIDRPSPPKGRSYVVSSAGWELRWTQAALKAELAHAGRDDLVSMARARNRRTAHLRTAKPCGPGRRCYGQALAKRLARQPVRWRESRWGDGGKKELGSGESTAYGPSNHRAGKAWFRLPCVSPVHCVCICSARGSLRVPAGARPSLRPCVREGEDNSITRAHHAARTRAHVRALPAI